VVLHVYFQALLRWGLWEELVSDHGGQFISHDFARVNKCDLKQKMAMRLLAFFTKTGLRLAFTAG